MYQQQKIINAKYTHTSRRKIKILKLSIVACIDKKKKNEGIIQKEQDNKNIIIEELIYT